MPSAPTRRAVVSNSRVVAAAYSSRPPAKSPVPRPRRRRAILWTPRSVRRDPGRQERVDGACGQAAGGPNGAQAQAEALEGDARTGGRMPWQGGRPRRSRTRRAAHPSAGCSSFAAPQCRPRREATKSVATTPALVMPLLNLRTQIQPPSKTWCTAACSWGYGGVSGANRVPSVPTFLKCAKSEAWGLETFNPTTREAKRLEDRTPQARWHPPQSRRSAPPACPRACRRGAPVQVPPRIPRVSSRPRRQLPSAGPFEQDDGLGRAYTSGVSATRSLQAVPTMSWRLKNLLPLGGESPAEVVVKEREAPLQPARHFRIARLPGAPFRERAQERKVKLVGDLLDQEVCQRRGRILRSRTAGCLPRSTSAVDSPRRRAAIAVIDPERSETPTTT